MSSDAPPPPAPSIVKIPTPVWVLIFIVVAVVLNGALGLPAMASLHSMWLGIIVVLIGGAVAAWGRMTFAEAKTQVNPASVKNDKLVTAGPYKFTRNPMYLGLVIVSLGAAILGGLMPLYAVPVLTFLLDEFVIIPFEERKMERQHGDAYREYKRRVRRWI